jgi:CubicO group peptidase (beta-lactamase class C family)
MNDAIVVSHVPGTQWSYSGSAYLVVQQLMMDVSGQTFPNLMRRTVFAPLGMSQSTFEQPLPPRSAPDAARGTLMNGNPVTGGWHVQPEMAAGGLWTTSTDLAKLAIEVALESRGLSHRILAAATARAMLAPQWSSGVINILGTPNDPDSMGYGFFVGARHRFGHIGGNVGYQATMLMFADTGNGAIIMTNSDIGLHVGNAVLNAIAKVYGWDYAAPPPP